MSGKTAKTNNAAFGGNDGLLCLPGGGAVWERIVVKERDKYGMQIEPCAERG